MTFTPTILVVATLVVCETPGTARAQDNVSPSSSPASRITVSAQLGYAYPIGSTERGNDTRDVSFGLLPLSLAGAFDLGRNLSAHVRARYAPNIPTLCASAPDCLESVGHDLGVDVGIGWALPRWRRYTPQIELEVGWEWLTTELSDSGVATTRSWTGPAASLELFVDLRSGGPWSLGPTVGIAGGIFSHFDLETPAWRMGGTTATAVHVWPTIAFRVGRRL